LHYLYKNRLGDEDAVSKSVDAVAWSHALAMGRVPLHVSCLDDKEVIRHMSHTSTDTAAPPPLGSDSQLGRVLALAHGGCPPAITQDGGSEEPLGFLTGIVDECFLEAWEQMSYSGDWMESQETGEYLYKRVAMDWSAGANVFRAACMARSGERDALNEKHQFAGVDVSRITGIGTVPLSPPLESMARAFLKRRVRTGGPEWAVHTRSALGYKLFQSLSRTENLNNNTLNLCESDEDEDEDHDRDRDRDHDRDRDRDHDHDHDHKRRNEEAFLRVVAPMLPYCLTGLQHGYLGSSRLDALRYDVLPEICRFLLDCD
jgi:hypothetical protein